MRQCLDYLSYARRGLFPSDPILPIWGIVTDMNEFRLYWFDKAHHQSLRFAQKILDRCIFIFFCEDMGQALAFPPKLLQEFLIDRSNDPYFDSDETNIWQDVLRLFRAMNEGRAFGGKAINQFNGGLFSPDDDLDRLQVPNSVFCQHLQGSTEASLYSYKETLLYLCASYNYASDLGRFEGGQPFDRDPSKSLGLYTLGRIFEQSITELEILEAEADGRPSTPLNG